MKPGIAPAAFPRETLVRDLVRRAGIFQTWRRNSPDLPAEQCPAYRPGGD